MSVFVVGISGGSGAPYALRLLEVLLDTGHQVKLVVSPAAEKILKLECGVTLSGNPADKYAQIRDALKLQRSEVGLEIYDHGDLAAPVSSGSYPVTGMVIVPCSMGTLGRIASGVSTDLISRAADVSLKERRRLIVVPRETPLSDIHLGNMLTLSRAGATVLPAMPGFYHAPESINDLVDMIVGRILDHLDVENRLFEGWKGEGISEFLSMEDE